MPATDPPSPAESPVHDGLVDWDAVREEEIPCARCGQNLRGIELPRCPECGFAFEWDDLFVPERRRHPFLYEHHTGVDRRRRFWRTILANLRPIHFWRSMRVTHLHCRGKLIAFSAWGLALVSFAAVLAGVNTTLKLPLQTGRPVMTAAGQKVTPTLSAEDRIMGTAEAILDSAIGQVISLLRLDWSSSLLNSLVMAWATAAIIPLTAFGFGLFGGTLRKHRAMTKHIWRLTVYPGVVCLTLAWLMVAASRIVQPILFQKQWLTPANSTSLAGAVTAAIQFGQYHPLWDVLRASPVTNVSLLLVGVLWWTSLAAGGTVYLKVPRWWLAVLASQVIALLVLLTAAVLLGVA